MRFRAELEMTGITRTMAARVLANAFYEQPERGSILKDEWLLKDRQRKEWKILKDEGIKAMKVLTGGYVVQATEDFKVKLVTPLLESDKVVELKRVINLLRQKGAFVNDGCKVSISVRETAVAAVARLSLQNELVENGYLPNRELTNQEA